MAITYLDRCIANNFCQFRSLSQSQFSSVCLIAKPAFRRCRKIIVKVSHLHLPKRRCNCAAFSGRRRRLVFTSDHSLCTYIRTYVCRRSLWFSRRRVAAAINHGNCTFPARTLRMDCTPAALFRGSCKSQSGFVVHTTVSESSVKLAVVARGLLALSENGQRMNRLAIASFDRIKETVWDKKQFSSIAIIQLIVQFVEQFSSGGGGISGRISSTDWLTVGHMYTYSPCNAQYRTD